jgi:hypothetical protein
VPLGLSPRPGLTCETVDLVMMYLGRWLDTSRISKFGVFPTTIEYCHRI